MNLIDAFDFVGHERKLDLCRFLENQVEGWGLDGQESGFMDEALVAEFLGWS